MKIEKIVCDCCGADITEDNGANFYGSTISLPMAEWASSLDLCPICALKITKTVKGMLQPAPDWLDGDFVYEANKEEKDG